MKRQGLFLLFFILAAIAIRFFSFFPSELDHDEATYMLIGNEMTKGKALYADVTDTKPVAIFLVYAALQKVVGYSIFWKRFFVAILVGLTCFLVKKVSIKLFKDHKAAFAAGIIYLFYTSTWGLFGLSPNAELFFNLFTIAALLYFLKGGARAFFLAGFMMGIGFMFKYLTLFDYAAFVLFFFLKDFRGTRSPVKISIIVPYVLSGIGFLIPFALTAFYFYAVGRFDDFYFITFKLPGLYGNSPSATRYLVMMGDVIMRFFPITFFFVYVWFGKHRLLNNEHQLFFILWMLFDMVAIYLPGKEFSHYTIQLMLPVSLIAGQFFHSSLKFKGWLKVMFRGKSGAVILLVVLLTIQVFSYIDNIHKTDQYKQVAGYLGQQLDDDDKVFVSNYEPIIYYLLRQGVPGKYVHPTLLFSDLHKAFLFDNVAEVKRILDTHPKFVMIQYENEIVEPLIQQSYRLDTTFRNGEVQVFKFAQKKTN